MLTTDCDLKQSELQQIASADAMAGLFTALGYDTSQRVVQVPDAMGFPEALAREVVHMERIATHDEHALQVYLVELKHVTVALTQAIARVLKSRAGLFLFALTTRDYEDIDFVLFESLVPEHSKGNKLSSPQVVIRPRILSVDRRNPDAVSLRVLRRFSYTEIDAYYQWDKLRSAYSVAEWSEPLFNNRALFSDYYLIDRLPQRDEWKEEPRSSYQAINKLLVDVREKFSRADEAKVRADFLEPIFKALGWTFEKVKEAKDEGKKADYNLITSNGKKIPCLVYVWDRFLDGMDEQRDKDTPTENPAQSVVSILEESQDSKWAIVTNGKTWRLYAAQGQVNSYYEMDLEETLASIDSGIAFRYFWLLFRAKAFSEEPSFVDLLLTESASYAKALGLRLKDKVFDDVFPQFAEGFVKAWGKPAVELTDEELNETFHASLTFLYRLLFLLYAEARDLLPVKETRGYWETSLTRMKKEIAKKAGGIDDLAYEKIKKAYSASETGLYDRLSELFAVIDKGKAELNVPVYNGGLFVTFNGNQFKVQDEAEEIRVARFLSSHKIPDRYLAFGLDLLARDIDDKTQALVMIDYKSLGVRQLGSIYEGLLEFKLRVAREKMAVVAAKKGDLVVPYAEAEKDGLKIRTLGKGAAREEFIYRKSEVYLENDNHERKASGSYYTHDYIVKYNVQNTVGPALEERFEELRPKMREAEQAYHEAQKRLAQFEKMGQKGDDPEKTAYAYRHLVNELFDMRVLDPAMGSGHFLVETVDFITRRLLDFLNAFPWNPVRAALRQTRESILDEMQKQGVSIDPARLTDINLLKRFVLKRCIYGVDLNPMAVELAKVSLWLDCFTLGAPLSFLDHHLKCGNSLIGAQVDTVRSEIEMVTKTRQRKVVAANAKEFKTIQSTGQQFQMFGSMWTGAMLATDLMQQVGDLPDTTAEQVHKSREEYHKAADALAPFKRILDMYTSRWFGNDDNKLNQPALQFLRDETHVPWLKDPKPNQAKLKPDSHKIADIALKAAREKRFFHWELEFPEVFFGHSKASHQEIVLKENPGFNVVVGNPPYIQARNMDAEHRSYYYTRFRSAIEKVDIFAFFCENMTNILAEKNGRAGFVLSTSWLGQTSFVEMRRILFNEFNPRKIIFNPSSAFDANVETLCLLFDGNSTNSSEKKLVLGRFVDEKIELIQEISAPFDRLAPDYVISVSDSEEQSSTILKIEMESEQLGEFSQVNYGLKTGDDTIFVTEEPKGKNPKRVVFGENIQSYIYDWAGLWVNYVPSEMLAHRPTARPATPERFESVPKIVFKRISQNRLSAALDMDEKIYCTISTIVCSGFSKKPELAKYIMTCVNSKLMLWYVSVKRPKGFLATDLRVEEVNILPIRKIGFYTPVKQCTDLINQIQASVHQQNFPALLTFVEARLSANPEEADVVHDLLAYLAEQMIELNKQKQGEMKRFLSWLEGVLKVSVDELTGKSKLRNYIGNYQKGESEVSQAELEDIFYKNRNKLGVSLSDARPMAKIRDEYEKSLAVLRPLKQSLRWTDGVIDQVVYRLYGLTEEEVRVVEGKAG